MNTWLLRDTTAGAYDSEATRSRGFGRVHTGARAPSASRRLPEQARAFPGCAHLVPTVQRTRSRRRARPDVPPASSCKTKSVFYPCTPEVVRTVRRRAGAPCTRVRYNTSSAPWPRKGAVEQAVRVVCVIVISVYVCQTSHVEAYLTIPSLAHACDGSSRSCRCALLRLTMCGQSGADARLISA